MSKFHTWNSQKGCSEITMEVPIGDQLPRAGDCHPLDANLLAKEVKYIVYYEEAKPDSAKTLGQKIAEKIVFQNHERSIDFRGTGAEASYRIVAEHGISAELIRCTIARNIDAYLDEVLYGKH